MTGLKIEIIFCEQCHDATLFVNGVRVEKDRMVSSPFQKEGHTGVHVSWEDVRV